MFTGIVTALGRVAGLDDHPGGALMRVAAPFSRDLATGESVAVSGCCLTVVDRDEQSFTADLTLETLARTAFRPWGAQRTVNLERALQLGDRLSGHIVQGHVDGCGEIAFLLPDGDGFRLGVRVPADLRRYVAVKGSFAVNGISLTVTSFADGVAEFALIPHTYRNTDLSTCAAHEPVHLEVDIVARYIESLTRPEEA